jgi:predicted phage terminase large subunit-like protein
LIKDLSPEDIAALLAALPTLPRAEQEALLADLETLDKKKRVEEARGDFLKFAHFVYPNFKEGPHHRHLKPLLHGVNEGTELRLTVSMAPRFGKSATIAYLFVAWYLGHNPDHQIMMVTHTADLSADFGRQVRNLLDSDIYHEVFPDTVVSRDKSAASNWSTTLGGKYLAIGIGANVAGHGAHLLIGDDLVSEQAVLSSDPDKTFAQAWEYMQVGPLQRLMPGGKIVMIGCMTAETGVLMANGTEKEIQHIQVGDTVATYDNGTITTSRITNWIKHPSDFVYKIITSSGIIVRANKRHPFLVDRDGARSWVRLRDLKVGDCLVRVVQPQDAGDPTKLGGCAASATKKYYGAKDAQEPSATPGTGESGKGRSVPSKDAAVLSLQKGYATVATAKNLGVLESTASLLSKSAKAISSIGTACLRKLTPLCWKAKAAFAQSANNCQLLQTQGRDKYQSSTSITAMTPNASEDCCATTAIWQLDTQTQKQYYSKLQNTYDTTPDAIVEITEDGFEPVFDMEVERTENFIANGIVSHNTRWGKKDPIGRALAWAEQNPESLPWKEVRFPAILPSGKSLWPEQWPVDQLLAKKAGMFPQFWAAQYMQEPTSEEGALIKREWWRIWPKDDPPDCEIILQSWDTAHGKNDSADPSGVHTWGVFHNEKENQDQLILLDAWTGRKEFPELKKFALEYYKEWEPDIVIIEKKAAGAPLIQEMRATGLPINEYTPSRGADKRVRINSVADMFASGMVWRPDRRWAQEVSDQIAEFPNAEHDEHVDCTSMALMRFRQGGFIRIQSDEKDEPDLFKPRRSAVYY